MAELNKFGIERELEKNKEKSRKLAVARKLMQIDELNLQIERISLVDALNKFD